MNGYSRFAVAVVFAVCVVAGSLARAAEVSHPNKDEIKRIGEASCAAGFSFAVIGDSHNSDTVFKDIVGRIDELNPDFAVSVGDFTNNGKPAEYVQFLSMIKLTAVPWLTAPGNHEYRNEQGHTSVDGPKRFKSIFGPTDFFFDHCGWRFIVLDVPAMDMLMPQQLKKLGQLLAGHEGRAAVFMHYPPSIITHWQEGIYKSGAADFMKLMEKYKVPLAFFGHIHVYDHIRIGPTEYVITGGGGGGMDTESAEEGLNAKDGGAFHHFLLVRVKGGEANYSVVRP